MKGRDHERRSRGDQESDDEHILDESLVPRVAPGKRTPSGPGEPGQRRRLASGTTPPAPGKRPMSGVLAERIDRLTGATAASDLPGVDSQPAIADRALVQPDFEIRENGQGNPAPALPAPVNLPVVTSIGRSDPTGHLPASATAVAAPTPIEPSRLAAPPPRLPPPIEDVAPMSATIEVPEIEAPAFATPAEGDLTAGHHRASAPIEGRTPPIEIPAAERPITLPIEPPAPALSRSPDPILPAIRSEPITRARSGDPVIDRPATPDVGPTLSVFDASLAAEAALWTEVPAQASDLVADRVAPLAAELATAHRSLSGPPLATAMTGAGDLGTADLALATGNAAAERDLMAARSERLPAEIPPPAPLSFGPELGPAYTAVVAGSPRQLATPSWSPPPGLAEAERGAARIRAEIGDRSDDSGRATQVDIHPELPVVDLAAIDDLRGSIARGQEDAIGALEAIEVPAPRLGVARAAAEPTVEGGVPDRSVAIATVEDAIAGAASDPSILQGAWDGLAPASAAQITSSFAAIDQGLELHRADAVLEVDRIAAAEPPITGVTVAARAQAMWQSHRAPALDQASRLEGRIATERDLAAAEYRASLDQRDATVAASADRSRAALTDAEAGYSADLTATTAAYDLAGQAAVEQRRAAEDLALARADAAFAAEELICGTSLDQAHARFRAGAAGAEYTAGLAIESAGDQATTDFEIMDAQLADDLEDRDRALERTVHEIEGQGSQRIDGIIQRGVDGHDAIVDQACNDAQTESDQATTAADAARREAEEKSFWDDPLGTMAREIDQLLEAAAGILERARAYIISLLEGARQDALAELEAARQEALAEAQRTRDQAHDEISAAADAERARIADDAAARRVRIHDHAAAVKQIIGELDLSLYRSVEEQRAAINAAIDAYVARLGAVGDEEALAVAAAAEELQRAFNAACEAARGSLAHGTTTFTDLVDAAADDQRAEVAAAEARRLAEVDAWEAAQHARVDADYAARTAAISQHHAEAAAEVNAYYDAKIAAVDRFFAEQIAGIEAAQAQVALVAEVLAAVVNESLVAIGAWAASAVEWLQSDFLQIFVDFWNSPWRDIIIIGVATVVAVAITAATLGAGAPLAAVLWAAVAGGVIAGTIGGTTYAAGEYGARNAELALSQDQQGDVYLAGGSDGVYFDPATGDLTDEEGAVLVPRDDIAVDPAALSEAERSAMSPREIAALEARWAALSPEDKRAIEALRDSQVWAFSNFETRPAGEGEATEEAPPPEADRFLPQEDGSFVDPATGARYTLASTGFLLNAEGKPVGKAPEEILRYAKMEGVEGAVVGFVSGFTAVLGNAGGAWMGGQVAARLGLSATSRAGTVVAGFSGGVFEGGVDMVLNSAPTEAFKHYLDLVVLHEVDPAVAFEQALAVIPQVLTDPSAWGSTIALGAVSGPQSLFVNPRLSSANAPTRNLIDAGIETSAELSGSLIGAAGDEAWTLWQILTGEVDGDLAAAWSELQAAAGPELTLEDLLGSLVMNVAGGLAEPGNRTHRSPPLEAPAGTDTLPETSPLLSTPAGRQLLDTPEGRQVMEIAERMGLEETVADLLANPHGLEVLLSPGGRSLLADGRGRWVLLHDSLHPLLDSPHGRMFLVDPDRVAFMGSPIGRAILRSEQGRQLFLTPEGHELLATPAAMRLFRSPEGDARFNAVGGRELLRTSEGRQFLFSPEGIDALLGAVGDDFINRRRTSTGALIVTQSHLLVGDPISLGEGQTLLRQLADGDSSGLAARGIDLPASFDTRQVEWGLAEAADGTFWLERGDATSVDCSRVPGLRRLISHTHPLPPDRAITTPQELDGILAARMAYLLYPSSSDGDVGHIYQSGQMERWSSKMNRGHVIYLPYQLVSYQDGRPVIGQAEGSPSIAAVITSPPRVVGTFPMSTHDGSPPHLHPIFETTVEYRADGVDRPLYRGTFVTYSTGGQWTRYHSFKSDRVMDWIDLNNAEADRRLGEHGFGRRVGSPDPVDLWRQTQTPVGHTVFDRQRAEQAVLKLAGGGRDGLTDLGMYAGHYEMPDGHWLLAQWPDGSYGAFHGDAHGVDLSRLPRGVRPVATAASVKAGGDGALHPVIPPPVAALLAPLDQDRRRRIEDVLHCVSSAARSDLAALAEMQRLGRVRGVDLWLDLLTGDRGGVRRLETEIGTARVAASSGPPGRVVELGNDPTTEPVSGRQLPGFAIRLIDPDGNRESIEVKAIADPVTSLSNLSRAIGDAARKLRVRAAAGTPIDHPQLVIHMDMGAAAVERRDHPGAWDFVSPDGARTLIGLGGRQVERTNLFDAVPALLDNIEREGRSASNGPGLERVTLITDVGTLLGKYERRSAGWVRVDGATAPDPGPPPPAPPPPVAASSVGAEEDVQRPSRPYLDTSRRRGSVRGPGSWWSQRWRQQRQVESYAKSDEMRLRRPLPPELRDRYFSMMASSSADLSMTLGGRELFHTGMNPSDVSVAARRGYLDAARYVLDHAHLLPIDFRTAAEINRRVNAPLYGARHAGRLTSRPSHEERIEVRRFYQWLESPAAHRLAWMNPIAFAERIHHDVGAFDAFADGNGRTGRLMADLVLLQHGRAPALYTEQEDYFQHGSPQADHPDRMEQYRYFVAAAQRGQEAARSDEA